MTIKLITHQCERQHPEEFTALTPWASCSISQEKVARPCRQLLVTGKLILKSSENDFCNADKLVELDKREAEIVQKYWGTYCAILVDPSLDMISVLPEPTGTRDVYFCRTAEGFLVSTSLQWLVDKKGGPVRPNLPHFIDTAYALDRYGVATGFLGISRIPFGHSLRISGNNTFVLTRVWPNCLDNQMIPIEDATDRLLACLNEVFIGLSESEAGIFLSGGRDSTLIAGAFANTRSKVSPDIQCVHLVNETNRVENESEFAISVANSIEGNINLISSTMHASCFSLQSPQSRVIDGYRRDRIDALTRQLTGCRTFFDGKGGDAIFIEKILAGYLTKFSVQDILKLDIMGDNFAFLLISKIYTKLFSKKYLVDQRNPFIHGYLRSGILTKVAREQLRVSTNYTQFKNDIDWLLTKTSVDKATYLATVLPDMVHQNDGRQTKQNIIFPLISQPVLELLFSLDLRSMLISESRSLQRSALCKLGFDEIANRNYKTGTTSMIMKHIAENEQFFVKLLAESPLVEAQYLDLAKIKEVFFSYRCGVSSNGGHATINAIRNALFYREYGT